MAVPGRLDGRMRWRWPYRWAGRSRSAGSTRIRGPWPGSSCWRGPGRLLLAYAVHATEATVPPSPRPRRTRAAAGALVWTAAAYAWQLPPLDALDGAGAQAVRDLTWIVAGVLLWLPALAPGAPYRGPLVAAHLAAVPLGLAMLLTGRPGAGLLMLAADAVMAACTARGRFALPMYRALTPP